MGKVERDVPSRKLVDADNNVVDGTHPLPVEIAGASGDGSLNVLSHGKNPDNVNTPIKLDSVGALVVTGAGAEPTATSLRLQDASVTTQHAAVDATGQVSTKDGTTHTKLDSILAQLDDATTDTVLSVMKAVLADLQAKADLAETQPVSVQNFPASQTVDGTVGVSNTDFPDATAHTKLDSILAQLDDASTDTVLSVLKALHTELSAKTEPIDIQNIDGTVTVDNHPTNFPDSSTHTKLDTLNAKDFATQTTLEAVRVQTAAINANTDAVEALLTELRDNQLRRTDPIAAGTNVMGKVQLDQAASHFISSSGALKVEQGKFFVGGRAIDLGGIASTDRAVFRLANPTGSGKNIYVMLVTIYSSITQQVKYNEDGTITSEGTISPRNLNRAMGAMTPSSVADLTYAKTAVTGGTDWPNESRVYNSSPLALNFSNSPLKLGQGKSILVRGTSGDAQTFTVNAYWFEEVA